MRGCFKSSQASTMRKYDREWVQSQPCIAKIYEAIAGFRRMGSEGTVKTYVKAIRVLVEYLGYQDAETALVALKSDAVNAEQKIDTLIDCALEEQDKAQTHVRSHIFGIKKRFELNGVQVDWKKIELENVTCMYYELAALIAIIWIFQQFPG